MRLPGYGVVVSWWGVVDVLGDGVVEVVGHGSSQELMEGKSGPE